MCKNSMRRAAKASLNANRRAVDFGVEANASV
jgi:hypothetical protein